MGHEIRLQDGIIEVRLSGDISKFEILLIIAELMRKDPGKKHPDIWILGTDVHVPYSYFKGISEPIGFAFLQPPADRRSAIVVADEFQRTQLELYRSEASGKPLDIRVFRSYEEALVWIKGPEGQSISVRPV